jgi:hypothetical protein
MHGTTRPAPEAHESQRLRGATPPRHRPRPRGRPSGIGRRRRAVVDSATRAREFGGKRCDANKLATKSGLPCQRKHAEIRRKKLEKTGGNSAFAHFCSLLCDGRTECLQRPYLSSSTFVFACWLTFHLSRLSEAKHARPQIHACMPVSEGMCTARTSSLQSHYIIVSILVQYMMRRLPETRENLRPKRAVKIIGL